MSNTREWVSHDPAAACHGGTTSRSAGVAAAHASAAARTKWRTAADERRRLTLAMSATVTIKETLIVVFKRNSVIRGLLFLPFLPLPPAPPVPPLIASRDRRFDRAARPRASSLRRPAARRPRPRRSRRRMCRQG